MAEFPLPAGVEDLTGRKVVNLTVTGWWFTKNGRRHWICDCDCGRTTSVAHGDLLIKDKVKSCGCWRKKVAEEMGKANVTHGDTSSPEWLAWKNMRNRCYSPNDNSFQDYGGRGIVVCDRWLDADRGYENFLEDMGRKPSNKHSIDRKEVEGNYTPDNCWWATAKEQQRNRRNNRKVTAFGRTQLACEWADEMGIETTVICSRLNKGWTPEEAVTLPTYSKRSQFLTT